MSYICIYIYTTEIHKERITHNMKDSKSIISTISKVSNIGFPIFEKVVSPLSSRLYNGRYHLQYNFAYHRSDHRWIVSNFIKCVALKNVSTYSNVDKFILGTIYDKLEMFDNVGGLLRSFCLSKNLSLIYSSPISEPSNDNTTTRSYQNSPTCQFYVLNIVGPNAIKDADILIKLRDYYNSKLCEANVTEVTRYVCMKDGDYCTTEIRKRYDEIFSHEKKLILDAMRTSLKKMMHADKYNLPSVSGILVYGIPGTGKSETTLACANEIMNIDYAHYVKMCNEKGSIPTLPTGYTYTLYLPASEISLNNNTLGKIISDTSCKTIIAIMDDVDVWLGTRDIPDDIQKDSLGKRKFDRCVEMMNLLSNGVPGKNILFILITNYKDKLDPALIRSGRIDFHIPVGNINRDYAEEMCRHYDCDPDKILADETEFPINPAYLQGKIIKELYKS